MVGDLLVYGAYGYTGELIAAEAVSRAMSPTLAGRDRANTENVAAKYNCDDRVFAVDEAKVAAQAASEHDVVLNCAGPFADTAAPLVRACLEAGTHYLDITGEIDVFETLAELDAAAAAAEVTVLPGVGFDVVPTDCLAAHLHERRPDAATLELAFEGSGGASAGTIRTALRNLDAGAAVRRDGTIETPPAGSRTREVDFGDGERTTAAIAWGDVATASHTTGVENVAVYMAMPPSQVRMMRVAEVLSPLLTLGPIRGLIERLAVDEYDGPDAETRAATEARVWGEVTTDDGERVVSRLRTPNTYELTVATALQAAERTMAGDAPPGFQTPAGAFGADFVLAVDGVEREDVV